MKLPVGTKDPPSVIADGTAVDPIAVDGVRIRRVANMVMDDGCATEIYRRDWRLDDGGVEQVFQRVFDPGIVSAWHMHRRATERLFCAFGRLRLVLFDGREASPTAGAVAEFRLGVASPATIVVPPGVWHGIRTLGDGPVLLVNSSDRPYAYDDPDHWRLPWDTADIPYRFA